jgi:hypothetical protein
MQIRPIIALSGTTLALVLTPLMSTTALAAGNTVSVRVEGKTRTLLSSTTVSAPSAPGSFTIDGTPAGACLKSSAAGALDAATRHRWGGTYSTSFNELELTTILGERWTFSSPNYWSIWVNDRFATAGLCDLKLHKGDQLLLAAVPDKGSEYPLAIEAPSQATAGRPFTVKVVGYFPVVAHPNKVVVKPVPDAQLTIAGHHTVTNGKGFLSVTDVHAGTIVLNAGHKGDIRAATVRVRVSG